MSTQFKYLEYPVKPGENLSRIISKVYDVGPGSAAHENYLLQTLSLNPQITNPDLIFAGSSLLLKTRPDNAPVLPKPAAQVGVSQCGPFDSGLDYNSRGVIRPNDHHNLPVKQPGTVLTDYTTYTQPPVTTSNNIPIEDQENYWMLSWLAENSNFLVIPGSTLLGAQSNLLNPGNIGLIREIEDLYIQYKIGKLTKGQYDHQRKLRLDRLKNNIGPLDRYLFGSQTPHEAIRIACQGGVPATRNIQMHANRLAQMSSYGKYGGYLLTGVGVAASCKQIADTDSRLEKSKRP